MVAISTNLMLALRKASFQGFLRHLPLGLDLLEDRRLLQLQPDLDGDHHQQEGDQERNAPAQVVERVVAEVGAACR